MHPRSVLTYHPHLYDFLLLFIGGAAAAFFAAALGACLGLLLAGSSSWFFSMCFFAFLFGCESAEVVKPIEDLHK